jgi:two-component system, cell cycle response regulator DivK
MNSIPKTILDGWNIVVIDDEPDSLEVAEIILMAHGATVFTATNGQEGLEVIRTARPRLIISDISMPVLDGWGVIDALTSDRALMHIPAIALTAHAMHGDRERAIAAGFHNHLTKPLTAETFIRDLLHLLTDLPEFQSALAAV